MLLDDSDADSYGTGHGDGQALQEVELLCPRHP